MTAPDPSASEFEAGYIAEDGTRHRVPACGPHSITRWRRPLRADAPSTWRGRLVTVG